MSAARELLDEAGLDAASLSAIARRSRISKANLYRYFESREDILLELTLVDAEDWIAELERELAPLAEGRASVGMVVEILSAATVARPRLCALVSSLSSALEHNVGPERIAEFKRSYHGMMDRLVAALAAALPGLDHARALEFMTYFYVFVAGAWPVSHPPPSVAEVLAREEFRATAIDFEAILSAHARALLAGMLGGDDG